jgi:4a-hydroxytetrahydrobiopterin dehydratase
MVYKELAFRAAWCPAVPAWGTRARTGCQLEGVKSMSTVLSDAEIQKALNQLSGWKRNGKVIERMYQFDNFIKAMEFVNQIAEAAEAVNHHPDIFISYNKVTLSLVSHDSGGVTQRDIKMASRINELSPA